MPKKEQNEFIERDPNTVPSEAETRFDEKKAAERAEFQEGVGERLQEKFGAPEDRKSDTARIPVAPGNPHGHQDVEIPADARPGIPLEKQQRQNRSWPNRSHVGDYPVVEDDPEALRALQDPYGERFPQAVPMVSVRDSYGNTVLTPA